MQSVVKKFPLRIGMRTLKTAVAVGVTIWIGYLIGSPYPPFLAIGALGAIKSSITDSFRGALELTLGNLIGAILAIGFSILFYDHKAFGCFLGVLLMIPICNALKIRPSTINLACVVFCCTFIDIGTTDNLLYGLVRFRDTVIGTAVALIVNMLIRPYSGVARTKDSLKRAQQAMLPLLEQRVLRGRIPDLRELRANINELDTNINVMLDERLNRSLKKSQVAHLRGCQQLLWKMRDALIGICCIDTMPSPSPEMLERMNKLGLTGDNEIPCILDGACGHEDTVVFNYYLKIFLDSNDFLNQLIDM